MNKQEAIRRVIAAYKIVLGMERDTPRWVAWDKFNYGRNAKAAVSVLAAFDDDVERAVAWTILKGNEWKDAGLSFTLETVARHGWDSGEIFNGQQASEVGSDRLLGQSSAPRITQAGTRPESASTILGAGFLSDARPKSGSVPNPPFLGHEHDAK